MTSLGTFLVDNLWPGMVVWSVLYISDYSLTLACARLYRRGVSARIVFEGSFEITPYFQSDIDSLKVVSPRFVAAMLLTWVYLAAVWFLAVLPGTAQTSLRRVQCHPNSMPFSQQHGRGVH